MIWNDVGYSVADCGGGVLQSANSGLLRATRYVLTRISYRNSVCPSVRLSDTTQY